MKKKIFFLSLLLTFSFQPNAPILNPESVLEKKEQKGLQYEVTVVLKLIQVYVTDKEGNPVTDLDKSEFTIFDNGEFKEITEFERHILPRVDPLNR